MKLQRQVMYMGLNAGARMEDWLSLIFDSSGLTEFGGVLVSIPLSIIVAVFLDARAEARRRHSAKRSLIANLVAVRERLFVSLPAELTIVDVADAWQLRLAMRRTMNLLESRIEPTLVQLMTEFSLDADGATINALEQESDVWHRISALLRFSSAYLANATENNTPRDEITAYLQNWLNQTVDRLEDLGDVFSEIQRFNKRRSSEIANFREILSKTISLIVADMLRDVKQGSTEHTLARYWYLAD
jgi:hypothetical protein